MALVPFPHRRRLGHSTTPTKSPQPTPARSSDSPKPSIALQRRWLQLANKLQTLALIDPAAVYDLEKQVDQLLDEVS